LINTKRLIYNEAEEDKEGVEMKITLSEEEKKRLGIESWSNTQARLYASDIAESVLFIYEHICQRDARPRHAITTARNYARMIELKAPESYIEEARQALIWASEAAKEAAVEAILLDDPSAHCAASAAAHAASLDDDMIFHAMAATYEARRAAFYARDEILKKQKQEQA